MLLDCRLPTKLSDFSKMWRSRSMKRTVISVGLGSRTDTQVARVIFHLIVSKFVSAPAIISSHGPSQFTWHRNPNWSRFYSGAEEIWNYFKDVATTYDLEKYVKFNTRVESAVWQEDEGVWKLSLVSSDGTRSTDICEVLVNGSGVLNSWKYPDIPGISEFKGKLMHSATWDREVDLKGKTVAVIGGGSSAVQIVPQIQPSMFCFIPHRVKEVLLTPNSCGEIDTFPSIISLDHYWIWRQICGPRRDKL